MNSGDGVNEASTKVGSCVRSGSLTTAVGGLVNTSTARGGGGLP